MKKRISSRRRRSRFAWSALATAAAWAACLPVWAGTTTIALTDGAPPEGNGSFSTFGQVTVLNNSGQVVFYAFSLKNTSGGTLDDTGFYLYDGSSVLNRAREGAPLPEGNGSFGGFASTGFVLNSSGQLAFLGLPRTSAGTLDDSGIYLHNGSSLLNRARENTAVPEGNGTFNDFGAPVLNASGQLAFYGGVRNPSGKGIYLHNGSSLLNLARLSGAVPEGNGSFSNFSFSPVLNASGQVAFYADLKSTSGGSFDDSGIYLHNGSTLLNIARENAAAPGGNGSFSSFSQFPVLNDSGQVAFYGFLKNTSGGSLDDLGIFLHNGSSVVDVARESAPVPEGNGAFNIFNTSVVLNGPGQVAFVATLKNTSGGTLDDSGVYLHNGSSLVNRARENAAVPEGNGSFNSFGAVPVLNGTGQVAFVATLKNTSGGTLDDGGIYLTDDLEQIKVIRKGDSLAGKTVSSVSFGAGSGGQDGRGGALNDFGQVAYRAIFTDTTEGVFLFTPDLRWRSLSGGNWDSLSNWTLGLRPGAVHDVKIDPAVSMTILGPASTASVKSLQVGGGSGVATLQLQPGASLIVSGTEYIASAGAGRIIQSSGTNQAGSLLMAGSFASVGTYQLSGGTLTVGNTLAVGVAGPANFQQSGGVGSTFVLNLGSVTTGSGYFTIDSGTFTHTYGNIGVSGAGSIAQNGGQMQSLDSLNLGFFASGIGYYSLTAGTLASLYENIGLNGIGTMLQNGGFHSASSHVLGYGSTATGYYSLSAGGDSVSRIYIGYFPGATGTMTLSGTGSLNVTPQTPGEETFLSLGDNGGAGTFIQSGGTANISGPVYVGRAAGSTGRMDLSGGSMTITGSFIVGQDGSGTVNLSGTGSLTVTATEVIGSNGTGVFNQTGGTHTSTIDVLIAANPGSAGTYLLSGGLLSASHMTNNGTFLQSGGLGLFNNIDGSTLNQGTLLVNGGSLIVNRIRQRSMTVSGTGSVTIVGGVTPNDPVNTSLVRSLAILPGAQLNLGNNSMIVDYDSQGSLLTEIRADLQTGRLTSSQATSTRGLGYGDNAGLGFINFAGQPVDLSSLLIKYTYFGDGNLDGMVDIRDLYLLASHFNAGGTVWTAGDFNYDGLTNAADLTLLARNWQAGVGAPLGTPLDSMLASLGLPAAQVPEPTAVVFCLVPALLLRRRRFVEFLP